MSPIFYSNMLTHILINDQKSGALPVGHEGGRECPSSDYAGSEGFRSVCCTSLWTFTHPLDVPQQKAFKLIKILNTVR